MYLNSLLLPFLTRSYSYQERGGAQDVLDAIDSINIHMLPFFSQQASTGKRSARSIYDTSKPNQKLL
jgi:hypothetical protein